MTKSKIWIISDEFYPNVNSSTGYFMTSIAEKLSLNNNVSVITTSIGEYEKEIYKNIQIFRIKNLNLDKNKPIQRLFKLIFSSISLTFKLFFNVKTNDKIFCVTNPALIILFVPILKKIKNINCSILVYDVFPENLHATGLWKNNSFLFKLIRYLFNKSYSSFDNVITIGRDMQGVFKNKISPKFHKNIKIITNWAETNIVKPSLKANNPIIKSLDLNKKIVIQFAGNIGRAQGVEKLISKFGLTDPKKFHFIFIGDGALLPKLKADVLKSKIKNITFLGSLPRSDQNLFLNACDIGLVTLSPNMYGLGVPSKSYNILSAQKPILFIGNIKSEIALMIEENNIGWTIDNNDVDQIPTVLNQIYEKKYLLSEISVRCRETVIKKYSKEVILEKYNSLLSF